MRRYLGRMVAVGRTPAGYNAALYRVSSRSFPNRQIVELAGGLAVVPRKGCENDVFRNPYIAYNCVRLVGDRAVLTNGSHTDPIAEKLEAGAAPKDALALAMLALDYEKDSLKTPRIAALVDTKSPTAWLAVVRHDALVVKEVALQAGAVTYVATYEANDIGAGQVVAITAAGPDDLARAACEGPGFVEFEHPVTAAAVVAIDGRFAVGCYTVGSG